MTLASLLASVGWVPAWASARAELEGQARALGIAAMPAPTMVAAVMVAEGSKGKGQDLVPAFPFHHVSVAREVVVLQDLELTKEEKERDLVVFKGGKRVGPNEAEIGSCVLHPGDTRNLIKKGAVLNIRSYGIPGIVVDGGGNVTNTTSKLIFDSGPIHVVFCSDKPGQWVSPDKYKENLGAYFQFKFVADKK
jgi:hypothetical protein